MFGDLAATRGSWFTTPILGCGTGSGTPTDYLIVAMGVLGVFMLLWYEKE